MKAFHALGLLLALLSGSATAVNVHNVTWVRKPVAPGTVISLGGQNWVLVRLPMKEFSNGNRYVVEFLTPVVDPGPPIGFLSDLTTAHNNVPIVNPVTVSGFPAAVDVFDGRSYSYSANLGFQDGLSVDASVFVNVNIEVGDTLLTLSAFFAATQQTLTPVTPDFSASPWASWAYADPTALVTHVDNWIDYIRVLRIN